MLRVVIAIAVSALVSCTSVSPPEMQPERLPGARVGGPFDGWVWVSTDRPGCKDCSVMVPPTDPRARTDSSPGESRSSAPEIVPARDAEMQTEQWQAKYRARVREAQTRQARLRESKARRSPDAEGARPDDPCNLTADDIRGWSAARITAAFNECAEQTGYTEDAVDHTAGMIACRTRLRDAGRLLGLSGHGFRWASTALNVMFTDTRERGDVATYSGAALEVQDSDGSWIPAGYECVYDHESGQIVDVRTGGER